MPSTANPENPEGSPILPWDGSSMPPSADTTNEVAALFTVIRLALLATLIASGSICALILGQDVLLWRQIKGRTSAIEQLAVQDAKIINVVHELQKLGQRFPEYNQSVLAPMNLAPVASQTNAPPKTAPARKP